MKNKVSLLSTSGTYILRTRSQFPNFQPSVSTLLSLKIDPVRLPPKAQDIPCASVDSV